MTNEPIPGANSATDGTLRQRCARWIRDVAELHWEDIIPRYGNDPVWLRQLALQLELWLGDELRNTEYFEMSHGAPAQEIVDEAQGKLIENNARNAKELYIRALTRSFFVAVDVSKEGGELEAAGVSVFVTPRDRLEDLGASEWMTRAPEPDTIRLRLKYSSDPREFNLPHADDYIDVEAWRDGASFTLFRSLRTDLWANGGQAQVVLS